jgi:hypothetical protein
MGFTVSGFLDEAVHVFGFGGQDIGVIALHAILLYIHCFLNLRSHRVVVKYLNTLRTGDANLCFLHFCITAVKDE